MDQQDTPVITKSSTSKRNDELDQTVIDESLTRQVATVMLTGVTIAACSKRLGIRVSLVKKILDSARYKELVTTTAEEELAPALAKAKSQLSKLTYKAVRVVERAMDAFIEEGKGARDALQAASVVLKSVGLHEEKDAQQDQNITIVLPEGVSPITYEVPKDENND